MPGGFHPFHAGHMALYNSAKEAFPNADVYVAATDSTEERPFPFQVKEKLAKVAGVDPGRFIQVKSPFKANEITDHYDPEEDVLIFVRSEKDRNESPKPGGTKKDGSPSYFQPWTGKNVESFNKHAYMAYLPTVTFGPGIKSATEIRNSWPNLNSRQKTAMVMSLYPATQKNPRLAQNVVQLLTAGMSGKINEADDIEKIRAYNAMMAQLRSQGSQEAQQEKIRQDFFRNRSPEGPQPPHGSTENEIRMFLAGTKPAALINDAAMALWDKIIKSGKYIVKPLYYAGKLDGYVLGQPNEEDRTDKLQRLAQGARDAAEKGDMRAYQNRNYHRWIGKLLGYPKDKIEAFIANYFKDTPDYAKRDVHEAQLGQTMPWPEFTNDLTKAMRATGWGAVRKNEDAFIFSIKGQEEDEFYVIIVQNIGNGFFRYGLGTVEQGDPHMDDAFRGELPLTRASLSQLMEMIREGYGLVDEAANAAQQAAIAINMKKHHKKPKIQEFAPGPGGDDGEEPDEEEILRRLASQWWNGTEQQMFKAEKTLAAMGWEIGQDEGYDQGGVFVVRAGDEHGKSYISWPHESLDEIQEAQSISEVGDQPYEAGQRWRSNGGGEYTKSTTLPDGRQLEIVVEYEKPYALVNFYIDSAQQKTGKGDAYKIFATVGKEVNDFVGKYKPDILAFTASMAEESRVKLYDRFADRMVKSLPNFSNYTNISDDEELYGDLLDFADARHDIQEQILYVFASPKYMKQLEAESLAESTDYLDE